jgi:hypothetical protein
VEELIAAYYEMAFRNRYALSKGEGFQDLFSTIMEMRYPGEFVRVRPWGSLGDHKNDGYLPSKRKLFQCYAPREMNMTKCKAKINEDFSEALFYWKDHFDEWIFMHNDIEGLPADILKLLLELSATNAPVVAVQWGYPELLQEFNRLSETDMARLLGPAPGRKSIVDVRLVDIQTLLDHIALQPEPHNVDVRAVPTRKLEYNQLSEAAGILLKAGMSRSEVVKKYLRGLADQTRYDRTAASFRLRYQELRGAGRAPDDIFVELQKFVAGDSVASPSHQAAALAILAFFFEACEIFERPPESTGAIT